MRLRMLACSASLVMGTIVPSNGHAQESDGDLHLRSRVGVWNGSRELDDRLLIGAANLWVDGYRLLGDDVSLKLEAWLYGESESGRPRRLLRSRDTYLRLGEGDLQLRLGWQIFAWGRADRINPTDNVSARDYRRLVSADDEQRFGSPAASLAWSLNSQWQAKLLAKRFEASVMPGADRERSLPWRRPVPTRAEWGIRLDRSAEQVDGSISWFDGFDKQRSLSLTSDGHGVWMEHPRLQMLGMDVASTYGLWTFRAEAAAIRVSRQAPIELGGKQSSIQAVAGLERNLGNSATLNLQWIFTRLQHALPATPTHQTLATLLQQVQVANGQPRQVMQALSLRYAQRLMNDELDYEVLLLLGMEGGGALRPRLNWELRSDLRLGMGFDLYRGQRQSVYGRLHDNTTVFCEATYSF